MVSQLVKFAYSFAGMRYSSGTLTWGHQDDLDCYSKLAKRPEGVVSRQMGFNRGKCCILPYGPKSNGLSKD
jgi:hypothetical protein